MHAGRVSPGVSINNERIKPGVSIHIHAGKISPGVSISIMKELNQDYLHPCWEG